MKKLANIWFYYKWYILAGLLALIMAGNFFSEKAKQVEPDYYAAVVTGAYISEQTQETLARQLEKLWPDADGDGTVTVQVLFYPYDGKTMESEDTSAFMAAAVQLAADLQEGISCCFFTDSPEMFLENTPLQEAGPVAQTALADLPELMEFTVLTYGDAVGSSLFP